MPIVIVMIITVGEDYTWFYKKGIKSEDDKESKGLERFALLVFEIQQYFQSIKL